MKERIREHSPQSYYSLEPNETIVLANHRGKAEVGVPPVPGAPLGVRKFPQKYY